MTQAVTPKDFRQQLEAILPAGCAGRLGSFVTDADLGDSPPGQRKRAVPAQKR